MSDRIIINDLRVHRPRDKEQLLQQLLISQDGIFSSMAEVLVFSACLAWSRGAEIEKIQQSGETIRFDIFRKMDGVEAVIDSIAALSRPGDSLILGEDRTPERIEIFEGYANSGLEILQGEILSSRQTVADTLIDLVRDAGHAGRNNASGVPDDIRKLLASPE